MHDRSNTLNRSTDRSNNQSTTPCIHSFIHSFIHIILEFNIESNGKNQSSERIETSVLERKMHRHAAQRGDKKQSTNKPS
jgi:hypothetical protein